MSLPYPISTDAPVQFAVMPDWGEPITQTVAYRTDITRARRGLEQRAQRQKRPVLGMEYKTQANDQFAARRIETVLASARSALLVPWWVSGSPLAATMTNDTQAILGSEPIADDWDQQPWVYIWSRLQGASWRQLASRNGRNLTLIDTGTHIRFAAGSICFPVRLAIRQPGTSLMEASGHKTARDTITLRTI